jgi:regulatory protein YycI of two-component signal transduction system YycFG
MDFRRIEWIFLIVFIGLNIFLGISFYQSQEVDQAVSESTASEIVADIQRDQIKLPKLSTKTPTGGYLASQTNTALLNNRAQLVGIDTTITNKRQGCELFEVVATRLTTRLVREALSVRRKPFDRHALCFLSADPRA